MENAVWRHRRDEERDRHDTRGDGATTVADQRPAGIVIFVTFLVTVPGIIMPTRGWLKIGGGLVAASAIFSMCIGVYLWVLTLSTRDDFFLIWTAQADRERNMMQMAFECCGYFNSTTPAFVTNAMCTSPAAAALMRGCANPISSFSNVFIDDIFTAMFGMVGTYFPRLFPPFPRWSWGPKTGAA
jgi:hypothetical protein